MKVASVRWPDAVHATLDAAIGDARAGVPTLLAITGEPGMGKSTLLEFAASSLDGFTVLRAFGDRSSRDDPWQLFTDPHVLDAEPPRHVLQGWRLLADHVDRLGLTAPVALVIDDLQWIDADSVAAVAMLVQRAAGDRLLVVGAHRPLGLAHSAWRRCVTDSPRAHTISLTGLSSDAAAALVDAAAPAASADLVEALREHTGGNPLHMRALLAERSTAELASVAARGELPAPADLAATMAQRIEEMAVDSAKLLRALAILGDDWHDLPVAAAVAGVVHPDDAIAVLRAQEVVRVSEGAITPSVRIVHGVIAAAVYASIEPGERRRLNQVAAARATDAGARLRHRLAAADGPDEGLAQDLDRHAANMHAHSRFRDSARFYRLAASVSGVDDDRVRRELDAVFELIVAREEVPELVDAETDAHHRFVEAMRLSTTKQWLRAAELLAALDDDALAALGPRNGYRALVVRGWAIVGSGGDAAQALVALNKARELGVVDDALGTQFTFAYGQAMQASALGNEDLWGFESMLATPRSTLAATPGGVAQLMWRGAVHTVTGTTGEAIADLSIVTGIIDAGHLDFGDGVFHSMLGFAQWMAGQWTRATANIGVAQSNPLGVLHPMVLAMNPLTALANRDGDGESLADAIESSRRARLAAPLPGAVHAGDIADVVAMGFAGSATQRSGWLARRVGDFGDPAAQAGAGVPYLWMLSMGIAGAWAGDADGVEVWAQQLELREGGAWRLPAVRWLRALADGVRGKPVAAELISAARDGLSGLDSVAALLWADAASAAVREGHSEAASTVELANAAFGALGAQTYGATLVPTIDSDHVEPVSDPLAALSAREREVVARLCEGLSYAQIAKEIYVSRSTVAFHLSNAYAKTGTTSRHELVQLARG